MKKIFNWKVTLLIIVALAAFLRFYNLGSNPPSLTWDEAAWGYNAYTISISGKDEFGRFLPIDYLESFGDFKPPLYAYLTAGPVRFFGLNEFAVRFPSALFGTLTVLLTYFLVKQIFASKQKNKEDNNFVQTVALISALFLAISPWHIMLSRAAFEANVASFLIVLGVLAFLKSVKGNRWFILLASISFALSIFTFNTARVVSPLIVLFLALAFRKDLLRIKKQVFIAIVLGVLMVLPILGFLLSPQANLRFREVNIFSDINVVKAANQQIANDDSALYSKIIHNRRVLYALEYVKHYFDNLSPRFLFISGDGNPKFSTQTVGQMYIWDIMFFAIGILFLFKKKQGSWFIIPIWLLLGIIPAATARETPHALRIEATLPTFQIITAYGFVVFLTWAKKLNIRVKKYDLRRSFYFLILTSSFILLSLNFIYFYHDYSKHYADQFSGEWQYGYKQSIAYAMEEKNKYDFVQITNALGRPYIYYLFYTQISQEKFIELANINRDAFGFVKIVGFDKFRFPDNFDESLNKGKKVLYINTPFGLPSNIKILKTFYLLNGQPILVAYTL